MADSAKVAIIMGSDSDYPVMKEAENILKEFSVPYEIKVVSAHRTPDEMYSFAKEAEGRGIQVIIAGAGGAAHLPGMVASLTNLPVIGVPIRNSAMNGEDALLSIVQMPKGVPVACMAIDNATNAGIFAIKILANANKDLKLALANYREGLRQKVLKMNLTSGLVNK